MAQRVKNSPALQELKEMSVSGRSPGEGNGNPLQYSCLGNPMDRGAWWATVHGVAVRYTWTHEHIHFISRGVGSILVYTHTNSMLESALSFCTWDLRNFSPQLGLSPHDRIWTHQGQSLTLHLYILQCTKWYWFYTGYPNKVLINRPSSYHDL